MIKILKVIKQFFIKAQLRVSYFFKTLILMLERNRIRQEIDKTGIELYCPNLRVKDRATSLYSKEPGTIEWIDSFDDGCVFWDVGSNIGTFSLYTAIHKRAKVLAFEPLYSNFYVLKRNIEINKLNDQIDSFCVALSDKTKYDFFYVRNTEAGYSGNSFGEPVGYEGDRYDYDIKESVLGYSIDDFIRIFQAPFPNYIKIDVDGIEDKIIFGASQTLKDNRLKSILFEYNTVRGEEVINPVSNLLERNGFKLLRKDRLVDNTSFSYIFCRK